MHDLAWGGISQELNGLQRWPANPSCKRSKWEEEVVKQVRCWWSRRKGGEGSETLFTSKVRGGGGGWTQPDDGRRIR